MANKISGEYQPLVLDEQDRSSFSEPTTIGTTIALALAFSFLFTSIGFIGAQYMFSHGLAGGQFLAKLPTSGSPTLSAATSDDTDATIAAVKKVRPAVVSIVIEKDLSKELNQRSGQQLYFLDPFGQFNLNNGPNGLNNNTNAVPKGPQQVGAGTGFIVGSDGMILTNRHVVADEEAQYKVFLEDGRNFDATVVARDQVNDLAIIKIKATDLPVVTFGDSDTLQVGQTVLAIGNALSEYSNSVTKGIVSGIGRSIVASDGQGTENERLEDVIQTDAAINLGNSGGPLINLAGEVVGVDTAVDRAGQSVAFAIPANDVKVVVETVKTKGKIVRPQLGVRYVLINKVVKEANKLSVDHGAIVQRGENSGELAVIPAGPADKAGIVENDIILEVDGTPIDDQHSLMRLIQRYAPGKTVTLKILHKGKEETKQVTLGTLE